MAKRTGPAEVKKFRLPAELTRSGNPEDIGWDGHTWEDMPMVLPPAGTDANKQCWIQGIDSGLTLRKKNKKGQQVHWGPLRYMRAVANCPDAQQFVVGGCGFEMSGIVESVQAFFGERGHWAKQPGSSGRR